MTPDDVSSTNMLHTLNWTTNGEEEQGSSKTKERGVQDNKVTVLGALGIKKVI